MSFKILAPRAVEEAYHRIKNYVTRTRLIESPELNNLLGSRIKFKLETEQIAGSFKVRGALNALLKLQELNKLPKEIAAFSSGNHAQGIAWAAKELRIKATIYLPEYTAKFKQEAVKKLGANVIVTKTRQEAEDLVIEHEKKGGYIIPPSDHDLVIAGNGTVCYEALQEMVNVDAVFAACGGGGLVSGTYLATKVISPKTKVFAAEPSIANDAAQSVKNGSIVRFKDSPKTIADGARTLGITPRIFHYLKQIDGFYEIDEEEIIFWATYLSELFKINCEPTAALAMSAAYRWLQTQTSKKEVLVILSGGNIEVGHYNKTNNNIVDMVKKLQSNSLITSIAKKLDIAYS